jgi:uncharacterized protein (TIGR03083 family)
MADRVPLSTLYQDARERVTGLLCGPLDDALPVPATPGWTIHDVLAHLTGVAEDLANGRPPANGPTPEWTAGHVERGRDVPVPELLDRWAGHSRALGPILDRGPSWAPVMDVGAHEQDLRSALGQPGARDGSLVVIGSKVLLSGLRVPAPLLVTTEDHEVRVGPKGSESVPDAERGRLATTTFEAFRWRLGRRSRAQLAAMAWSTDPVPFLDHLCIFGPAADDILE